MIALIIVGIGTWAIQRDRCIRVIASKATIVEKIVTLPEPFTKGSVLTEVHSLLGEQFIREANSNIYPSDMRFKVRLRELLIGSEAGLGGFYAAAKEFLGEVNAQSEWRSASGKKDDMVILYLERLEHVRYDLAVSGIVDSEQVLVSLYRRSVLCELSLRAVGGVNCMLRLPNMYESLYVHAKKVASLDDSKEIPLYNFWAGPSNRDLDTVVAREYRYRREFWRASRLYFCGSRSRECGSSGTSWRESLGIAPAGVAPPIELTCERIEKAVKRLQLTSDLMQKLVDER